MKCVLVPSPEVGVSDVTAGAPSTGTILTSQVPTKFQSLCKPLGRSHPTKTTFRPANAAVKEAVTSTVTTEPFRVKLTTLGSTEHRELDKIPGVLSDQRNPESLSFTSLTAVGETSKEHLGGIIGSVLISTRTH